MAPVYRGIVLKTWLYHSNHKPRIFEGIEAVDAAEANGWKDSPAKCAGFLDKVGVDPADEVLVQLTGEVTDQTVEVTNLLENIDDLDRKGILRLATLHLVEDWSKRRGVDKMIAAMKQRLA